MTVESLDFIFPFIVFAYGAVMTFVLNCPALRDLGQKRMPNELWLQFKAKRPLATICFVVGAMWSLQNLWL